MNRREKLLRLKRFRADALERQAATLDAMAADVERKFGDLDEAIARERHQHGPARIAERAARDG
jgi:hypothetical protein